MDFLNRLRRYLERVGQAPEGFPYVTIDVAAHRRFLLETIAKEWGIVDWREATLVNQGWSRLRTDAAIRGMASGINDELEPYATTGRVSALINDGIRIYFFTIRTNQEPVTAGVPAENRHLLEIATKALDRKYSPGEWEFPPYYAFEVRLVERRSHNVVLSRCGKAFLEMSGIGGVEFLVALEAAQAIGPVDEFRLSPELASRLAEDRHVRTGEEWERADATLERLTAFGLLNSRHRFDSQYWVIDRHHHIFEEIAQRKSTPYAILADALLRDETTRFLERVRPEAARMMQESAAETYALQARMVVHEIRNAILPVQVAFDSIASNIPAADASLQKKRARIDAGLQRALDFVDGMLRVANLGLEQPSNFDVSVALRDASAAMSRELNGGFQQRIDAAVATISGPRDRFVLAVTNLLRNAAQCMTGLQNARMSISTEFDAEHVLIHVDDSGPGVPVAQRVAIFEPGVTLRSGGSGQGLSLVRQVVEGEMGGTVTCTDGPLGGARFTLRISLQSRST